MNVSQPRTAQRPALAAGWIENLRQINLVLFAALPLTLLFSRGLADGIVTFIGLSFLVAMGVQRDWRPFREWIFLVLIAIWIVLNLLVSPLALDPEASFSRTIPWIRFVLFFAGAAFWVIQNRKDLTIFALLWALTLLGVAIDGFIQLAVNVSLSGQPIAGTRLTGPLDRPNVGMFAARIGIAVMAAWVWLCATRTKNRLLYAKPVLLVFAIVMVLFILLTGERTASLLTVLAIGTVVVVTIATVPRFRLHGIAGFIVAMLAVGLVLTLSERIRTRAMDTWHVIGNLWQSIYGELIAAGWTIWLQKPLAGVGLKNFRGACEQLLSRSKISECHPHPHNIYLEWLAEGGLFATAGFITFVVLFVVLLARSLNVKGNQRLAGAFLLGGAVLTLFPISISQSFFSNWPAILMWASLAGLAATARLIVNGEGNRS